MQVRIGRLRRTHGVRGWLKLELSTEVAATLLRPGRRVVLERPGVPDRELVIEEVKLEAFQPMIKFAGYDTPEEARVLSGGYLTVAEEELPPLEEGEYYTYQLMELEVVDRAGQPLGRVCEVISAAGSLLIEVRRPSGRRFLVPFNENSVLEVDLAAGTITIDERTVTVPR